MSFPRYPEYKDSGVEWLGEVPAHWSVAKFRHCFRESPEKIEETVIGPMLSVSGYRGIEIKEYDDENRRRSDEDLVGYRVVRPGQLVVNTMWLNYAGLGVSEYEGHVSPAYRSYWIRPELSRRFVHHLMRSETYVKGYTKFLTGIRPNSLQMSRDDLMVFPVLLPPEAEQEAIAKFLDAETSKIDGLVQEQEKLIALLKEKRQAVISHAVTKGLDPNVPMKDSGIEWLGDVPAHWEVKAIKWLSPVQRGASPRPIEDPAFFDDEGEYAWVRIADVSSSDGVLRESSQQLSELGSSLSVKLEPGQLFVSIAGTVGKPCITGIRACIHDGFVYFPRLSIPPEFLFRVFEAGTCYSGLGKMGTQLNLNTDTIGSIRIAIPPEGEITGVLAYIAEQSAKLDALICESEAAVVLLQERRSALISAAVTGKIDVRTAVTRSAS